MEILGVGGAELVAIFIIMLVVAGPKRMIQWAYILGKYTAKVRAMWAESMTYLQKEFDAAGLDVELPKEPPTRGSFNRQLTQQVEKAFSPVTKPVKDALEETTSQVNQLKKQATITESNGNGSAAKPSSSSNGNGTTDLGTWSANKPEE
jgi:Sec-independent protein translocase protein TatA